MMTRRHFFGRCGLGRRHGRARFATWRRAGTRKVGDTKAGLPDLPHFAPKAKRVIYLFQSGGPSQLDLFDYKAAA